MNKVKLSINTSPNNNLTYYIFRSTNQEDLPSDLNSIKYLQPLMTIHEATIPKVITMLTEELILDVSYIVTENMLKYILKHVAIKTNLTIKINFNNPEQLIQYESINLNITFDATGNISKLSVVDKDKTTTNYTDITQISTIVKMDGQNIYINKDMLADNYNVTCDYHIQIIEVEDYISSPIVGFTYTGPNAHGLKKPSIVYTECIYEHVNSVEIPYIRIAPCVAFDGIIYYYVVVGVDPTLNVTNPSSLIAVNLNQDKETVEYLLQVSDNYTVDGEDVLWNTISNSIKYTDFIDIGCPGTATFETFGAIVAENIPVFDASEIIINTNYVDSDNALEINFPNVWFENDPKYNCRTGKAYRLFTQLGSDSSEPSDIVNVTDIKNIHVEKMVVVKRNASNDVAPSFPSNIGQVNSEVIKTYIRKDGLYYIPIDYDDAPYDVPSADSDIIVICSKSMFETMIIDDDSCVPGQAYNYTFYLFDSYGKRSEPITILINL